MEQQQERNSAGAAKTGTRLRMFISFGLGTMLLAAMLVACGGSADATATTAVATAVVSNVKSSPSASASPVIPFVSASPSLPFASGSAMPSASGSSLPFLPSASPSSSPSAGAVAANSDGACPATHPVKAGQLGPLRSYAVSGDTSYDRLRATECFATEAEAETAGYRKSAR
jgi:hypothetical protein